MKTKTYKIPRHFYSELLDLGINLGTIKSWTKWVTKINLTVDEYDALIDIAGFMSDDRGVVNAFEIGRFASATALWHVLNDNGRP